MSRIHQDTATGAGAVAIAVRSMQIMATGELEEFVEVVHPEAFNRESADEPPATRGRGPEAFFATAVWLRTAFSELAFEVHDVVIQDDLVVAHTTMSGRHTGPFVVHGEDGAPTQAFPPTGERFAVTQSHWLRVQDGQVIEHWANRDDNGMARQLGWIPPSPPFLVRMALATRRARREARAGTR